MRCRPPDCAREPQPARPTLRCLAALPDPRCLAHRPPFCLSPPLFPLPQGGYTHFMEKEIFEQAETITQTMQGRVKITPLSPMKYAVPGIDPYLMPRVRMGGLVDHVAVSSSGPGGGVEKRAGAATCALAVLRIHGCGCQLAASWPAG